ncbi:hypothetical protein [Paraburkholderia sp.]|uniref:hypothetical protein n=2 Tax=Paraburkholderia sp. TaxID=1926495 RepID=UPI003C7AE126
MDRRDILRLTGECTVAAMLGVFALGAMGAQVNRLVLIHGRGQEGLNPEVLKGEWMASLKRGADRLGRPVPQGIDVAFPYYGDVLGKFASELEIPLVSDIQSRGATPDDEFLLFQYEIADAIRQRAGITDEQVEAEYGHNPNQRGPLNWQWVQAILRAIDKNSSGMSQKTLEEFTRDVFLYVTRAGVRDEIDNIVSRALTEQPTVVVSHSLGTVVAYSVLRTERRPLHVPLFVTLGSPLAVRAVRDPFRPIGFPTPVGAWYNAFDTRDVVALYPLDAENFPVSPAIENNSSVRNHTDNRHGIAGYLDDTAVARRVLDALNG